MTELLSRLQSSIIEKAKNPSPKQIQEQIDINKKTVVTPEEIWNELLPEIESEFISNSGQLKEKKIRKFMRNIELLLGSYSAIDLIKMDVGCIRKDGGIDEENFKRILHGETGD